MLQPIHALGFGPRAVVTDLQHLRDCSQYRAVTTTFLTNIKLNQVRPKAMGTAQGIPKCTTGHFNKPACRQAVKACLQRLE